MKLEKKLKIKSLRKKNKQLSKFSKVNTDKYFKGNVWLLRRICHLLI